MIRDLAVPDGFHGAVAVAGTEDFDILLRRWQPAPHAQPARIGVPMAVPSC